MTRPGKFAIYQLKDTPAAREFRFRSYQFIQEKGIRPCCGDYEKVYVGIMLPEDTPGRIRERFNRRLPKDFKGHSVSISDVLVLHEDKNATVYYVETSDYRFIYVAFSYRYFLYRSARLLSTTRMAFIPRKNCSFQLVCPL